MSRRNSSADAFTLVEIMVVVAIIGLLASIFVVKASNSDRVARVTAARAQLSQLAQAVELYALEKKKYPDTLDVLTAVDPGTGTPRLDEVPLDPWDHPYVYRHPGPERRPYEIVSWGEDGAPGGTGYARDLSTIRRSADREN
ncbi:MAG: type II secretion system major pseudopilin GspG [Planctomycetes bacterium]|nr:type II secretion system major pseudopilin GspG [Planctomycetota bacterium]